MSVSPLATFCTRCGQELAVSALFCPACGTPKSHIAETDPLLGQVLAQRFLVLERMGHGASGTIYRGEHTTLHRKVAIKVLHLELCRNDLAVERFRREATTVSDIDNDHIVEIYDFGRTPDDRLYLVMELLEGEPLQHAIEREKRLAVDKTVDILIQLGEALSEAHAMGYVHRDLRPRNIFLAVRRGRANFVKLLDFGLAKLVENEGNAATTSLGMNFGDPKYISPEQARGETVDRRADIYSLGCIAYEMLVGHAPFARGKAFDILARHAESVPPEPRALNGDVPLWLNNAIMRMLAKRPDDRFVTVYRLVEALRQGMHTGQIMSDEIARRRETIASPISSRTPVVRPPTDGPVVEQVGPETPSPGLREEPKGRDESNMAPPPSSLSEGHPGSGISENPAPAETERATEPDREPGGGSDNGPDNAIVRSDSDAGLSGAWFADGERAPDEDLDAHQDERLAEARNNVARDAGASFDELFYEPNNKRRLKIAAAIVGGVILVIIILAIAWPKKGAKSSETGEPVEPKKDAAELLAQIEEVPDAGQLVVDAGTVALDAATMTTGKIDSDTAKDGSHAGVGKPKKPTVRPDGRRSVVPDDSDDNSGDPDDNSGGDADAAKNAKQAAFFAQIGQAQLRKGELGQAAGSFKKALDLDAGNADALMGQGEIALKTGAAASAISLLNKAARKKPRDAHLLMLLGDAYLSTGKAEKAADYFKRALRIDPDNARAREGYNEAATKIPPPPEDDV